MRGHEILSSIAWSGDVHPDTIASIEAAILDLDRRVHGTNKPAHQWTEVHRRLSQFIAKNGGSYRKAVAALGISKSFLYDMHSGTRPYTDDVLAKLGLMRTRKEIFVPVD
jgi:hypothetical protein